MGRTDLVEYWEGSEGPFYFDPTQTRKDGTIESAFTFIDTDGVTQQINNFIQTSTLRFGSPTHVLQFIDFITDSVSNGVFSILIDGVSGLIHTRLVDPLQLPFLGPMAQDFYFQVAQGLHSDKLDVLKFGHNPDVDTASPEDVWTLGGTWVPPTTTRIHDVSGPAGFTGSINIIGLASTFLFLSETLQLTGATTVVTAKAYRIIDRVKVLGDVNPAADVSLVAQTDGTTTAVVPGGEGQTQMAIFQVPAGRTAFMIRFYANIDRAQTSGAVDVRLLVQPFGGIFRVEWVGGLMAAGNSHISHNYEVPLRIEEKSIIKMDGQSTVNNMDMAAGFDLILVDN